MYQEKNIHSTASIVGKYHYVTAIVASMHRLSNPGNIKRRISRHISVNGPFHSVRTSISNRNQTARTTADQVLFNNFFVHYGFPLRLHSDQGAHFVKKLIHELCQITGIKKSRTTPYHPMGNGMCERFNHTLLAMLGTLEPEQKSEWKKHVAPLVHVYNCTKNEQTEYSLFLLMFGRQPRLPVEWPSLFPEERNIIAILETALENDPVQTMKKDKIKRNRSKSDNDDDDDRSGLETEDDTDEDVCCVVDPPVDVTGAKLVSNS
ncbi:KRAB-A domain-containing protein 2-like [Mizuhopecten yessoensis]|uniref:KRAB-A domain-containing protein 2-like n=1 Tax=Mizuhopecten yessoensis TaxID=6573 RepID=UPI000B45DC4B|nr:KRAB-A domain-containing protein 2-like [Mizuhopecten yessoensis]